MDHIDDSDKSKKAEILFYQTIANPWPNVQQLEKSFNEGDLEHKKRILRYYFSNFTTTSGRRFEVDHTLPIMENLNKLVNFSELINNTPGFAYDCLQYCQELKHMRWAVEVLKINPICFSTEGNKVYTGRGGHFLTGKYTSIDCFRENGKNIKEKYHKFSYFTTDPKEVTTIQEELVYAFVNFKEVRTYLLELGAGKELLTKKLSFPQQLDIMVKNITCCTYQTFILFWILSLPFSTISLLNTFIVLGISLSINFLTGFIVINRISNKITSLQRVFSIP